MPSVRRTLLFVSGVALFWMAILAFLARGYGWNPSCFLHIGEKTFSGDHADLPRGLVLYTGSHGYDGLHYYQLARDPLLLSPEVAAPFKTDRFITRLQRVLYPALSWLAAAGREERLPVAMLAVNLAAVTAAAWLLFRTGGLAAGIWTATMPGLAIGLCYGLTEPVSLALAAGGLLMHARGRLAACALLLAGSCLARESSVLFIAALAAGEVLSRRWRAAFLLGTAVVPALLYGLWLSHRVGPAAEGFLGSLAWPFSGIFRQVRDDLSGAGGPLLHALPVWYAAVWATAAGIAGAALLRDPDRRTAGLLVVLHATLLVASYQEVWATTVNAGRIAAGLSLSVAAAAGASPAMRRVFLASIPLHAAVIARLLSDANLPYTLS